MTGLRRERTLPESCEVGPSDCGRMFPEKLTVKYHIGQNRGLVSRGNVGYVSRQDPVMDKRGPVNQKLFLQAD